MTHPAIQRFFGEIAPNAGPFELLGLEPRPLTDDAVSNALRRRLDRLHLHPLAAEPDADQVRLALHVAAAQLLDPHVRAELIHDAQVGRPKPVESPAPSTELERELVAAIAASHGWNSAARQRIAAIAARRGLATRSAIGVVSSIARPPHALPVPPVSAPTDPPRESRRARPRRWAMFIVTLLLIVSTIFLADRLITIAQRMNQAKPEDAAGAITPAPDQPSDDAHPATVAPPDPLRGTAPDPVITPSRQPGPSVLPPPRVFAPGLAQPAQLWTALAEQLLGISCANVAPESCLARAVQLARLNLAARLLWKGEHDAAAKAQKSAESMPTSSSVPSLTPNLDPAALTAPGIEPDGVLGLQLLTLRHQPGQGFESFRHRRFSTSSLGPVDCDVAAETALIGSPRDLRLIAQRIVSEQSDNPAMINAVLESLPKASRQSGISPLIAEISGRTLPDVDSPDWPVRARAALVERLAELLAPGLLPDADPYADMLSDAYMGRETAPFIEARSADHPTANAAADALWDTTLAEAAPFRTRRATALGFDAIIHALETRASLARGPIQRFVAAQSSIVELLALIVENEQRSSATETLLQQAKAERRTAPHVFRQIEINERAMTRLWILRLTGIPGEHTP